MKGILSIRSKTRIVLNCGDEGVHQESLDAGATFFLKKPTSIKEITETINVPINE